MTRTEVEQRINDLQEEIKELEEDKDFLVSQDKLDIIDQKIYDIQDTIKKLRNYV